MKMIPPPDVSAIDQLRARCASYFDAAPDAVRFIHAPYRLCPLGAHIDHQLGTVSSLATDHGILIAYIPLDQPHLRIVSDGFNGEVSIPLGPALSPTLSSGKRSGDWADYARGAAHVLNRHHVLNRGAALMVNGPIAEAGLSSSAAVGLGYLSVLADVNQLTLEAAQLVELDRQVENDFMSLKNGILDPAAIAFASKERLTVLDCASLDVTRAQSPEPFMFIAVYSGLREALVSSPKFNNRVDECLMAGGELRRLAGESFAPQPLGNTSASEFEAFGHRLEPLLHRRASHFFSECDRVIEGKSLFQAGDKGGFGALMTTSCESSINNYETGCNELVSLFETLAAARGVYGARFCGAGFRGCCVALIDADRRDSILDEVQSRYAAAHPQFAGDVWAIQTSGGAGLRSL